MAVAPTQRKGAHLFPFAGGTADRVFFQLVQDPSLDDETPAGSEAEAERVVAVLDQLTRFDVLRHA